MTRLIITARIIGSVIIGTPTARAEVVSSQPFHITEVVIGASATPYILFRGDAPVVMPTNNSAPTPPTNVCTHNDWYVLRMMSPNEATRFMEAQILVAYLSGRSVKVDIWECTDSTIFNRPTLGNLYLQ